MPASHPPRSTGLALSSYKIDDDALWDLVQKNNASDAHSPAQNSSVARDTDGSDPFMSSRLRVSADSYNSRPGHGSSHPGGFASNNLRGGGGHANDQRRNNFASVEQHPRSDFTNGHSYHNSERNKMNNSNAGHNYNNSNQNSHNGNSNRRIRSSPPSAETTGSQNPGSAVGGGTNVGTWPEVDEDPSSKGASQEELDRMIASERERLDRLIAQRSQKFGPLPEDFFDRFASRSNAEPGWHRWKPERMEGRKVIGKWLVCIPGSAVERLLHLAEPENWGHRQSEALDNLRNYLTHYFMRVYEQGDVLVYDRKHGRYAGQELIVFNTGLLTSSTTEIFAVMAPFKGRDGYGGREDRNSGGQHSPERSPAQQRSDRGSSSERGAAQNSANAPAAMGASNSSGDAEEAAEIPLYPPTRDWEYCVVTFLTSNMLTKIGFQGKLGAPPLAPTELPKRAYFFSETPECAVYNPNIPLITNVAIDWEHLRQRTSFRDNSSRLPRRVAEMNLSDEELSQRFRAGLERAKLRLLAHPRLAVPQFFRDKNEVKGELQLLVPISLMAGETSERSERGNGGGSRNERAGGEMTNNNSYLGGSYNSGSGSGGAGEDIDSVLTLRLLRVGSEDPGKEGKFYTIGTLLPPQMAFFNARLVQPVDQDWLRNLSGMGKPGGVGRGGNSGQGRRGSSDDNRRNNQGNSFRGDSEHRSGGRDSKGWNSNPWGMDSSGESNSYTHRRSDSNSSGGGLGNGSMWDPGHPAAEW